MNEVNEGYGVGTPRKFTNDHKVNYKYINWMVSQLTYKVHAVPDSTVTIVNAFYEGFHIAMGSSACVNPLNYNPIIGEDIATTNATKAATDKLWELLGWELHNYLKETKQLFPIGTLPVKDQLGISDYYPALQELGRNVANYIGAKLTPQRHEANLVTLKDSGKNFNGHSILYLDNGGPHFIVLASTVPSDLNNPETSPSKVEYTYVTVSEPALFQLKAWEVANSTKSANLPLIPTNGNVHPRQG